MEASCLLCSAANGAGGLLAPLAHDAVGLARGVCCSCQPKERLLLSGSTMMTGNLGRCGAPRSDSARRRGARRGARVGSARLVGGMHHASRAHSMQSRLGWQEGPPCKHAGSAPSRAVVHPIPQNSKAALTKAASPGPLLIRRQPSGRRRLAVHPSTRQPQHECDGTHGHAAQGHACGSHAGQTGNDSSSAGALAMPRVTGGNRWQAAWSCTRAGQQRQCWIAVFQVVATQPCGSPMGTIRLMPSLPGGASAGGAASNNSRRMRRPGAADGCRVQDVGDADDTNLGASTERATWMGVALV